jgi:hypothetical protein
VLGESESLRFVGYTVEHVLDSRVSRMSMGEIHSCNRTTYFRFLVASGARSMVEMAPDAIVKFEDRRTYEGNLI